MTNGQQLLFTAVGLAMASCALAQTTAGPKTCGPVNVPGNRSVQFALAGQCTLEPGSLGASQQLRYLDVLSPFPNGVGAPPTSRVAPTASPPAMRRRPDGGGTRRVYIGDVFANNTITTWNGAYLTDAGVWTSVSDAATKEAFAEVDARQVLAQVARLPVRSWRYKQEPDGVRHVGPTAQDFAAAFGLGRDDKAIGMLERELAELKELVKRLAAPVATR